MTVAFSHRGMPFPLGKALQPLSSLAISPLPHFYERPVNFNCGKRIHHPRIKPVIAGDTTYGISLLTDTISGSNFAIP